MHRTTPGLAVTVYSTQPDSDWNSSGCAVRESPSAPDLRGYQWIKDGADISGATAQNFAATVSGNYSIR